MSPAPAEARAARLLEASSTEHRSHQRYPIKLEVEYRVLKKGRVERGFGRTLNISSGGVFLRNQERCARQWINRVTAELAIPTRRYMSAQVGHARPHRSY